MTSSKKKKIMNNATRNIMLNKTWNSAVGLPNSKEKFLLPSSADTLNSAVAAEFSKDSI